MILVLAEISSLMQGLLIILRVRQREINSNLKFDLASTFDKVQKRVAFFHLDVLKDELHVFVI